MTKRYTLSLLVLCGFFWISVTTAQVSKGQKQLEDKNYTAAQASFAKDFNDPNAAPAAYLGWAKAVLAAKTTTYDSAMMAYNYLVIADSLYKAADAKRKAEMAKEGMSTGASDTQKKAALTKAWEGLAAAQQAMPGKSEYFDQLDLLAQLGFFKRGASSKKISDVRSAIVGLAWAERDDYASLSAVMSRHYDFVPASMTVQRGLTRPFRLWAAFVDQVGMKQFGEFRKAHPTHWASSDCKADAAVKAFSSDNVVDQFKFITDNPESCITTDALIWWFKQLPDKAAAKSSINSPAFDTYADMAEVLTLIHKQSAGNSQILRAAKALVPAQVAFNAVTRGVEMHLRKKAWSDARSLVKDAKSLFPEDEPGACKCESYSRKSWFKQVETILDSPDDSGGGPKALSGVNTQAQEKYPVAIGPFLYFGAEGRASSAGKLDPYRIAIGAAGTQGQAEPTTTFAGAGDEYLMSANIDGTEAIMSIDGETYYTTMGPKGWSKPIKLADLFTSITLIGRATLNPAGDYIIFAGRGANGNQDLFVSTKNAAGAWQPANPLPSPVNTAQSERSPFLHADGKSLYFTSDGHIGLGGRDIFMSRRLDDTWLNWTEPVNVGKNINTSEDDSETSFSVGPQGKIGYLHRPDASGQFDIYSVVLPEQARAEAMVTLELRTSLPNQQIKVNNLYGEPIKTVKSGPEGLLSFSVAADYESVILLPNTDTLFSVPMKVDLKNPPPPNEEVRIQTLGQLFQSGMLLPDAVFQGDSDFTMEGQNALERYAKLMSRRKPNIVVVGHSDYSGSSRQSAARAQAVKSALVGFGYDEALITVENRGADEPLGSNDTEAGRRKNRRVEVKVVRK